MTIAPWAVQYAGLRFKHLGRDRSGVDCWGLIRLVYAEQFGIALPAYAGGYDKVSREEASAISAMVQGGVAEEWRQIEAADAVAGDAVLLRIWGRPLHIGVLVGPATMLHIDELIDVAVERLDSARWSRRLIGYYRHRDAAYA